MMDAGERFAWLRREWHWFWRVDETLAERFARIWRERTGGPS